MGRTACTERQCLYKGALYLYLYHLRQYCMLELSSHIALLSGCPYTYDVEAIED